MENLNFDTSVYDELSGAVSIVQIGQKTGSIYPTYRIVYGNAAFERFIGYRVSEIPGQDFSVIVREISEESLEAFIGAAWRGEKFHYQRYSENLRAFVDVKVSPLREGYLLACFETLQNYTNTNLNCLTMDGFRKRVGEIFDLYPQETFDIIALDIKRFSYYNDAFGYEEGDKILREFVRRAASLLHSYEIIGHLGADRFLVLCAHRDFDTLVSDHQTYLHKAGFFDTSTLDQYPIDLSTGVYVCEPQERTRRNINSYIDYAISAQKKARTLKGISVAVFDKVLWQKEMQQKRVKETLNAALQNGSIQPWFQPQYNYATGKIVGAEVLARWIDPVQGFLSPADFIPILEESGEVIRLDSFIWDRACQCLRDRLDRGIETPLSINISQRDIAAVDIVEHINALTKKYDLPHRLLHLEITESAYMGDTEAVIHMVNMLRECGYQVEMDDFGSGYSSLNMLKDVSVSTLKIDMRFLTNLVENNKARSILGAIMGMAFGMDMHVIAEGVETKQQAEFLHRIGCSTMQGYLFARPMPRDQFEAIPVQQLEQSNESDAVSRHNAQKLWDLFENINTPVYVSDPVNLELVYLNKQARELFCGGSPLPEGAKCYEVLQGRDAPCENCNNPQMISGVYQDWSIADPVTGQMHAVKNTIVQENGKHYRLGIVSTVSESDSLHLTQDLERQVNEGIKLASKAEHPEDSIRLLMEHIGKMVGAERVHLTERNDIGAYSTTYEWVKEGVDSQQHILQNISPNLVSSALKALKSDDLFIVRDAEEYRQTDPAYYTFLQQRNVRSTVVVPLDSGIGVTGLYGVENISADRINEIVTVLETAGYFLNTSLRRRDLIRTLEHTGRVDALTGLQNRLAFTEEAAKCADTPCLAAVVLDVNNLKQCNDRYGHQEGDTLIRDASDCISQAFSGIGKCFRVGGDEFYILAANQTKQALEDAVVRLHDLVVQKNGTRITPLSIACGYEFREDKEDLEHLFVRSDEKMYENKYRMKDEFPIYREEQIQNYLRVLEVLSKSTDDYLFLMDIERDETQFFGDLDQNYAVREPGALTNSFAQMLRIVHPDDQEMLTEDVNRIITGISSVHNLTYRWVNRAGKPVWISCRGKVITDDRGKPFVMIGRVSDTAIKYMVNPMTGLFNESKMLLDIQKDLDMGSSGYLMMVGIQGLGVINEQHGWEHGNQCLKHLSRILQNAASGYNVYQVGNVAFGISLIGCGKAVAQSLIHSISQQVGTAYSICAGAVSFGAGYESADALHTAGAQALVDAKQQSLSCYFAPGPNGAPQ